MSSLASSASKGVRDMCVLCVEFCEVNETFPPLMVELRTVEPGVPAVKEPVVGAVVAVGVLERGKE